MSPDLRPGPDAPPADELAGAEAALTVLEQVLHRVSRDELTNPTPCTEFNVAQLTDHLLNSITTIGGAVGAEFPARDSHDSVERQVICAARPALDAWHRHGLNGSVTVGANDAPASVIAAILSVEFLVHAWDYAVATGREVDAPESLSEYVLGLMHRFVTPQGRATVGLDDPVDVPAEASALDRLIAFTGRNPAG